MSIVRTAVFLCFLWALGAPAEANARQKCKAKFIKGSTAVIVVGCVDGDFSVLDAVSTSQGRPRVLYRFQGYNGNGGFFSGFGRLRKRGAVTKLTVFLEHDRAGRVKTTLTIRGSRVTFDL